MDCDSYLNLSAMYDSCSGNDENMWKLAEESCAEGLRRFPDSRNSPTLRAKQALYLAVKGKTAEADLLLEDFEPQQTSEYYRTFATLAGAVSAAARGEIDASREQLVQAIEYLSRFSETSVRRIRDKTEKSVAALVPEMKGSTRRLAECWYPKHKTSFLTTRFPGLFEDFTVSKWAVMILFFLIVRACTKAIEG